MRHQAVPPHRNIILASLGESQLARLHPDLEPVDLPLGLRLAEPGQTFAHVVFPEAGIVSVVVRGPRGQPVEAGLFGREGVSGLAVALGGDRTPHRIVVQLAGHGHRIAAGALREAMRADGSVREPFLGFALALLDQGANTILAMAHLRIEGRLARWLLMCHDRVDGDDLGLTHEFLSIMLGVRRAGVTLALQALERRHLVETARGHVRVLDRGGLEAMAGGVYGLSKTEHAWLRVQAAAPEPAQPERPGSGLRRPAAA